MAITNLVNSHNTPVFSKSSIHIYHRQVDDKYISFPSPHNHDGFEIFQPWSEKGFVLINNKIFQMQKGCLYLINAIDMHWTNPDSSQPYVRNKVMFQKSFIFNVLEKTNQLFLLEPFINRNRHASHIITLNASLAEIADSIFLRMYSESMIKDKCRDSMLVSYLLQLLVFIFRYNSQNDLSKLSFCNNQAHIEEIILYLNNHYLEENNLNELSNYFHLNKYYMSHLFKEVVGITIMQYLEEKRIFEAKNMLIFTEKNITEICLASGYKNISVFNRSFKRITHVSPSQYRKLKIY